jgi:hypothetical protein
VVATQLRAFSGSASVADLAAAGTVWVAYTRPSREVILAHELRAKGIAVYLPLVERTYIYPRKAGVQKIRRQVPYFSRYLAFAGDAEARYEAYGSEHKSGIIDVPHQARLLRDLEITEAAIAADPELESFAELPEGCTCYVKAGPWQGKTGLLVERRPHGQNFLLYITTLGSAVPVEIDPSLLEKADEAVDEIPGGMKPGERF